MKKRKELSIQHPLYNNGNSLVDRISNLPDDLLCHILSFLPTKQAFTTTILSKRWTTLFYSVPVLDFNNEIFEDIETFRRFGRFVDNIMLSPLLINKSLKTFRLNYWFGNIHCHPSILNKGFASWLEAIKQRRVEEIHLSMYFHSLNPIIFISRTLVVLKLERLILTIDTSCVDLPSLKTLHLKFVCFQNGNDYINFLSACPILQDLHAEYIYLASDMILGEKSSQEAEGFKSLTLSKLVRASIGSMDAPFNCWNGVIELLHCCPKLEILVIKKWEMISSSKEWKFPTSVLECVSSHLKSCTILNFEGSTNDLRFAIYILQNARLLQDMKIGVTTSRQLLKTSRIIEELSSCPRISLGCNLSFEVKYSY